MKHHRLLELDALRGIGAVAVVLYHYFFRYNEIYGHQNLAVDWAYFGKDGVQLFFLISGFVIYWTLHRVKKPMDFWVSRFSRLFPVYWVALAITFTVVSFGGLAGREVGLGDAIRNMLMLHEYFGVPHVDGVYWTLAVELSFYGLIFVIYLGRQLRFCEQWLSLLMVLSLLKTAGLIMIPDVVAKLLIADYIMFFVGGVCFFKIYKGLASWMTVFILLLSLVSTIFIYSIRDFLVYSVLYALFFLSISGWLAFLRSKLFVSLGTISYSLYLIHQNIGYVIINQFYRWNLTPSVGIVLAVFISLLLAHLLTQYIEKPLADILRRLYTQHA